MIWRNILRRLDAVRCLLGYVKGLRGLSTKEKSSYYRGILIILYSIAEGMVYEIVRKNTTVPKHIFDKTVKYTEVTKIKATVLGTTTDVHLYRRQNIDLGINDDGANFSRLNLFLKHKRLVNQKQYNTLEWIRRERNRLHVQGLANSDVNYTDAKVQRTSRALKFLMTKV